MHPPSAVVRVPSRRAGARSSLLVRWRVREATLLRPRLHTLAEHLFRQRCETLERRTLGEPRFVEKREPDFERARRDSVFQLKRKARVSWRAGKLRSIAETNQLFPGSRGLASHPVHDGEPRPSLEVD